ncbi:MAG: PEP-CTERM sorting domain-containing protein [Thermogutta sp.]
MTNRLGTLTVFLTTTLLALQSAMGGIIWVDPNDYSPGQEITPPFVTLSAILGNTPQNPPDGRVLSLKGDESRYPGLQFFGWHIKPPVDTNELPWRGKWANLQAVFDASVSYVAIEFYRNDFYGGPNRDEIGFVLAFDGWNNLIWNEWVTLENQRDWTTVEISLPTPEIKKVIAGGVYVKNNTDQDILIRRLGYSVEPIPEPSSLLALTTTGLTTGLGIFLRRRRR